MTKNSGPWPLPSGTPHMPSDTWDITGIDPGIFQVIPGKCQVSLGKHTCPYTGKCPI